MSFLNFINLLYPFTASVMLFFYLPQILTVIKAKGPLNDISLSSWGVWSFCSTITGTYALNLAHDNKIAFFSYINAFLCFIVFAITLWKRFFKFKT